MQYIWGKPFQQHFSSNEHFFDLLEGRHHLAIRIMWVRAGQMGGPVTAAQR